MQHYDTPGFAQRYADARRLPYEAMRMWTEAIQANVDRARVSMVLDIGCGTGRFLDSLWQAFGADVTGIDRSFSMLSVARSITNDRIRLVNCDAARIPMRGDSFGLAFMSMVYHHLESPERVLGEIHRTLRKGGYLCIRTSTRDILDRVDYVKFFPSALAYNLAKLPSQHDVIDCARHRGFRLLRHLTLDHPFARSASEYLDKIGQRVNSDLIAVPDEEFRSGVDAMEAALMHPRMAFPITEPIDLFIFEAGPAAG